MNDTQDDPLLGLLTDIAEGVATLAARIDALEANAAAHQGQVYQALATIAEIATRTYFASNPSDALPDAIINAGVMDAMMERWPLEWIMAFPEAEFRMLKSLPSIGTAEIDAMQRALPELAEEATNAQRLRHMRIVERLNMEMDKRIRAQQNSLARDRNPPERSR